MLLVFYLPCFIKVKNDSDNCYLISDMVKYIW